MTSPVLSFFHTGTRKKEIFSPLEQGRVRMYTCGPTVYSYAHIGNFRTYVFEDLLRRTLEYFGYQVTQVMNITDVDDKTIRNAVAQGISLQEYVAPFLQAFYEDLDALHIQPAQHFPAATDYIRQMVQVIQDLLDKKIAYRGGDGSIYFAIDRFPAYGCLSHLPQQSLQAGASNRVASDEYEKEHAADFVLWKQHDPKRDGQIYWESPFGPGRPGWHLECSTMAMHLLGKTIDIHCGGVDNIFPHHENEIAQSEAYSGKPFVRYWMHAEHLIVDGKKMSKSLQNFYTLRDLFAKGYSGIQVRYLLLQTHYKTPLNFTFAGLDGARESIHRLQMCVTRLQGIHGVPETEELTPLLQKTEDLFGSSLADDLNISAALAAIFDLVRELNSKMDAQAVGTKEAHLALQFFQRINRILDVLSFEDPEKDIPLRVRQWAQERWEARKTKDWKQADLLRDRIQEQGYLIEDTPMGPRLKKME